MSKRHSHKRRHNWELIVRDRRQVWHEPWAALSFMKVALRNVQEALIEELGRAPLPTEFGDWTYLIFGDRTTGHHHEMLVFGNLEHDSLRGGQNVLTRLHSSCRTSETYHAVNCECREELHEAMQLIKADGRGVILYLEQEGRGNGVVGKLAQLNGMFHWQDGSIQQKCDVATGERIDTDRAYREAGYESEVRDFDVAGEMLTSVGVQSVRLLTNNARKIAGIKNAGISVTPVELHIAPGNEIIACDLRSKVRNLGHCIPDEFLNVHEA